MPPELRSRAVRMRERFHLEAPGWLAREEPVKLRTLMARRATEMVERYTPVPA